MYKSKRAAIKKADDMQANPPDMGPYTENNGPYFVMWDDNFRRWLVLNENEFMRECQLDYAETQEQTVYDTWTG